MRYRDSAGRLFHPGLIADIPTGRLLWVDQIHGNDDLAARERLTVPFKKLTKAKQAAVSGDTIVVMPGVYNENDLAKTGVNWHFMPGAVVDFLDTGNVAIFDTNSVGSACQFKVTGNGVFKTSNVSHTAGIVYSNRSGDDLTVAFDSVLCQGIAFRCDSSLGSVQIKGNSAESIAKTISIAGGGRRIVRIRDILSTGNTAVEINGTANVELSADTIRSEGGHGLHFLGATVTNIAAFEIYSEAGHGVHYDSSGSDPLHLQVGRIVSIYANTSGQAVYIDQGTDNLFLYGCILVADSTAVKSIDADAATTVVAMGPCFGNLIKGANVSFAASTFTQSSNVA